MPSGSEAEAFLSELRERFARFALELHPDKTRLIAFGKYAADTRRQRGEGKPETFAFLGFTHICAKTRQGYYSVLRHMTRERQNAKIQEIKREVHRRWHEPVQAQGAYLL